MWYVIIIGLLVIAGIYDLYFYFPIVSWTATGIIFLAIIVWYFIELRYYSKLRYGQALGNLDAIVAKDETIIATAFENINNAIVSRRELVAVTSTRIVVIHRSHFGGFNERSTDLARVKDIDYAEGKSNATITVHLYPSEKKEADTNPDDANAKEASTTESNELILMGYIKEQAINVLNAMREGAKEWQERNKAHQLAMNTKHSDAIVGKTSAPFHIRDAAAPGTITETALDIAADNKLHDHAWHETTNIHAKLNEYKKMLDEGLISDSEYDAMKKKLLKDIS